MFVYVPVANFQGKDPTFTWVYLYSKFGGQGGVYSANGGVTTVASWYGRQADPSSSTVPLPAPTPRPSRRRS